VVEQKNRPFSAPGIEGIPTNTIFQQDQSQQGKITTRKNHNKNNNAEVKDQVFAVVVGVPPDNNAVDSTTVSKLDGTIVTGDTEESVCKVHIMISPLIVSMDPPKTPTVQILHDKCEADIFPYRFEMIRDVGPRMAYIWEVSAWNDIINLTTNTSTINATTAPISSRNCSSSRRLRSRCRRRRFRRSCTREIHLVWIFRRSSLTIVGRYGL
jgi:hypothetical protein